MNGYLRSENELVSRTAIARSIDLKILQYISYSIYVAARRICWERHLEWKMQYTNTYCSMSVSIDKSTVHRVVDTLHAKLQSIT